MTNYLSPEINASVIYINIAIELWDDFQEHCSQSNGPRVFHLKQPIASLKQDQLNVSAYCTRVKALWDEFLNYRPVPSCTCGANCSCGLTKTLFDYQQYDYV